MVARGSITILLLVAIAAVASAKNKGGLAKFLKEHGEKHELKPCWGDYRYKEKGGEVQQKEPICQKLGFRFCMRIVNKDKSPYIFAPRKDENSTERKEDINEDGLDWWEWSTQPQHKASWLKAIQDTGHGRWCTCALCTSEAVAEFGCDNLDIDCAATDMAFIRYRVEHDKHMVLKDGLDCLIKKCGKDHQKDWPIIGHDCAHRGCARLYEKDYSNSLMPLEENRGTATMVVVGTFVGAFVGLVGGVAIWRRRGANTVRLLEADEALDDSDAGIE
jgi:hypothetical protein